MRSKNKYKIDIFNLANKTHYYQFEIDNAFFEAFPESDLDRGTGEVTLELHKSDTFMQLHFDLKVSVVLICDRSLDPFDFNIQDHQELMIKYGEQEEEIDENLLVITRDRQQLDLGQYIYEFIATAVPMRRLHPRYADQANEDELFYSSGEDPDSIEPDVDPRWEKLKNISKE